MLRNVQELYRWYLFRLLLMDAENRNMFLKYRRLAHNSAPHKQGISQDTPAHSATPQCDSEKEDDLSR